MSGQVSFLDLPGEIRNAIYFFYFTVDGEYVWDPATSKLSASDRRQPIQFELMLTCRQVAEETKGKPWSVNTIHFYTSCSDEIRVVAAIFGTWRFRSDFEVFDLLESATERAIDDDDAELLRAFSDKTMELVVRECPLIWPLLRYLAGGERAPVILRLFGFHYSYVRLGAMRTLQLIDHRNEYATAWL